MATAPVFYNTPIDATVKSTAANTKNDGTGTIGTDIWLLYTLAADCYIEAIEIYTVATAASTATTATVARAYKSSLGSGATTGGTDTWPIGMEKSLPSVTADHATNPVPCVRIPINEVFASGVKILVSTHHAPAANTLYLFRLIGRTA